LNNCFIRIGFFVAVLVLAGCSAYTTEPSFYYWRTKAVLSATEKNLLQEQKVNTLYIRFFDIDLSEDTKVPVPFGVIDSLEALPEQLSLVPVVYITNRTFMTLNTAGIIKLAEQTVKKINGLYENYTELQIDCDWSQHTKETYFSFLKEVKSRLSKGTRLTATIRLHQVKYPVKTGVPPVDGGMLMFYNMGDLHQLNGPNSIFDEGIANKYTAYIKGYELYLDVALPVFRWYVHYRNGTIQGLITKKQLPDINDTAVFIKENNITHYTVKASQLMHGVYYRKDDVLKYEALSDEELFHAAKLLQSNLFPESRRIVLYDLDDLNTTYYEKETFEKVFAAFN